MFFELLYDGVALGMWGYTRAGFRVETIGAERLELRPGTIVVSTHRADTDVPLICPAIYVAGKLWRPSRYGARPHFAAREDVFERGFFAGFPRRQPLAVRRILSPVGIGPVLRRLPMHPVAHPSVEEIRLGRALARLPGETPLGPLLPSDVLEAFRERAGTIGRPPPTSVAEASSGVYADLLWRPFTRDELSHPWFDEVWRDRTAEAAGQLRALVEIVRSGKVLLLFPEGRPSPDGSIGPLRKGVRALVRRGEPSAVMPVGIAYDPFVGGRSRAYVAFGEPLTGLGDDPDGEILEALRRTTPLTCVQVVAERPARAACRTAATRRDRPSSRPPSSRLWRPRATSTGRSSGICSILAVAPSD